MRCELGLFQAVLLAIVMTLLGCNGDDDTSTASNLEGMASIGIDGVTILFPTSFGHKDLRGENDVRTLTWSEHTVELDHGKLTFDGKVYGIVKTGEVVALAEDGTVSIDGASQAPLQPSNVTFSGVRFALEGPIQNVTHENGADRLVDLLGRQLELKEGQFTIDGTSFGMLEEGDVVSVSINGSISVNGEPREAQ